MKRQEKHGVVHYGPKTWAGGGGRFTAMTTTVTLRTELTFHPVFVSSFVSYHSIVFIVSVAKEKESNEEADKGMNEGSIIIVINDRGHQY